jgi:hypothetical protein
MYVYLQRGVPVDCNLDRLRGGHCQLAECTCCGVWGGHAQATGPHSTARVAAQRVGTEQEWSCVRHGDGDRHGWGRGATVRTATVETQRCNLVFDQRYGLARSTSPHCER